MPRTTRPKPTPAPVPPPEPPAPAGEVMTLAEAAAYLRLPEAAVVALVHDQGLPARLSGKEWRFLKDAVRRWLASGSSTPETRKLAQRAIIGSWKDDPYLEAELEEAMIRRGRPAAGDDR